MWANFKAYFSKEVRDYQKDQGLTAKSTYHIANTTNQVLLHAQAKFCFLTENFIYQFRTGNVKSKPLVAD